MPTNQSGRGQVITFYSYKGGTGRTMSLANVAWILASQGNHVLAVDWDLESPGLHRYYHPFIGDKDLRVTTGVIDMIREYALARMDRAGGADSAELLPQLARIQQYAVSLDWDFPGGGVIDFVAAGQQTPEYSSRVNTFDWANFYSRLGGAAFFASMREQMKAEYDYILIDSRTGLGDAAGICTVRLPDVVVNCFTMSTQGIRGAAAVARSIREQRQADPPRVLPVPMRVEAAETSKLERGRDLVRVEFAPSLEHLDADAQEAYWSGIEIPYQPFYAYEEILATFADRPRQARSLLASFENLTGVITDGRVAAMPQMPEETRRGWLRQFERLALRPDHAVVVAYASPDRLWAEWVVAELGDAGISGDLCAVDVPRSAEQRAALDQQLTTAARVVLLLTRQFVATPGAVDIWKLAGSRDQFVTARSLVTVRLDQGRMPVPFTDRVAVEVVEGDPAETRRRLLDALAAPVPASAGTGRRFPGGAASVWQVPKRTGAFVGRASALEALRDRFTAGSGRAQAVYGLGGVGKTQLAAQYAYRFGSDYDLVWWIGSDTEERIRTGLAQLGERLQIGGGVESVQRVLEELRTRDPEQRWLVILDNIDEPTPGIVSLLPHGPGHLLLTTRNKAWGEFVDAHELQVFDRAESVSLLRSRVRGLEIGEADQVAERLGDLPLAVEQAAAYLRTTAMPVQQYLASLDMPVLLRFLEDQAQVDYAKPVAATWLVALERLRQERPAAARLLELCSFYAPEPIPVAMLTGARFAEIMAPLDPTLTDPILQGLVTGELGRYALAQVDPENNTIRIHRLVQLVIRAQLADPEEARAQAMRLLAAANPNDPDKPSLWPEYAELRPHVTAVGLGAGDTDDARQLVADTVRYLYRIGEYPASRALAEDALAHWADTPDDDPMKLRMRFHLANALRTQNQFQAAFEIDQDVYDRQVRIFGERHPYTLLTARSLGADLRAHGRYAEATERDTRTLDLSLEVFGDGSARTLTAENNLAVSLRLVGDFRGAVQRDRHIHEQRQDKFGANDPSTLASASNYGRGLRDVGELWESYGILQRTHTAQQKFPGPDHPETLRTGKELALTLRQLGRFADAHRVAEQTLVRYRRRLGDEHPDSLSCAMAVATTWSGIGDNDLALTLAGRVRQRYTEVLGPDHAITLVCDNNLAIFLRKEGDHLTSRGIATTVRERLAADLGQGHPHVLLATVNLANDLFALGEADAALRHDTSAYIALTRKLGADHPDTLAAAVNLAISRVAAGRDVDAGEALFEDALRQMVELYGGDNPRVLQAGRRERFNVYIEPALL
ncbi:FxSxx-COOH system tetratricopeptide repeat protein [Dactylosporangium sp. NPDC000521]|uniref:FxSxx-COOH system tetratricopeptide repeat protein n=1 Tax=Dactylosporangium sp. NPDC000521 TaxID=3363975 RepID=UPI0036801F6D